MNHPIFGNTQFGASIVLAAYNHGASDFNLGPSAVGLAETIRDPGHDGYASDVHRLRDHGYLTFKHEVGGTEGESWFLGLNLTDHGLEAGQYLTDTL